MENPKVVRRTPIDALVTEKALRVVAGYDNRDLLEMVLEQNPEGVSELKNVCAKLHVSLSDRLDGICGLLEIHKRSFIESALLEAMDKAEAIIEAEGVYEAMNARSNIEGGK